MGDGKIVKDHLSNKIFSTIMQLKNQKIYKWIYKHPHLSIMILTLVAIFILYFFINFIIKYVV